MSATLSLWQSSVADIPCQAFSLLGQRHGDDFPHTSTLSQGNSPSPAFWWLIAALACHHYCDVCRRGISIYKLESLNPKPIGVLYHVLQTRWGPLPFASRCIDIMLI